MFVQKIIRGEVKVLDEKEGLVSAIASTETPDRDGDIIRQEHWNLDNFFKNPVLLSSHNYGSLKAAIGKWEDLQVKGKKLAGTARYFLGDGNEEAEAGFKLAKRGMAAFSVGFIPDMEAAKARKGTKGYEFCGQELLEVSQVLVPSNPTALQVVRGLSHPVLKEIIDEELENLNTEEHGLCCATAVNAELRRIVDKILAQQFTRTAGSGSAPSPEPDPDIDILKLIGDNHAN